MAQAAALPGLEVPGRRRTRRCRPWPSSKPLADEADAAAARRKSNGLLRRAIKAWRRGDVARAGQLALRATEADEANGQAFHVLAMALEKMGHLHKALVTYERAFSSIPTTRICCSISGSPPGT